MLCDFRLCRKMNARIWHQSWTLKTLSRTAKTKQVTTLQPFQSSCRVRKVASITRSDGLHSCDVWHGLQKPTSSCLQIDVTDSNLVQVLKDRNKEPFVYRNSDRHRDLNSDRWYLFACVNVVNSWKSVAVARERCWCSGEQVQECWPLHHGAATRFWFNGASRTLPDCQTSKQWRHSFQSMSKFWSWSLDSKSRVLTIAPWGRYALLIQHVDHYLLH